MPGGAYPGPAYPYAGPGTVPQRGDVRQVRPAEADPRRIAFKANFGIGAFAPDDVNTYIRQRVPSNAIMVQGFTEMVMLFSLDVSGAYFPVRFLGIRPSLLYLFAPKAFTVQGGENQAYWLHSVAPGLSTDLVLDQGRLARFFLSPGVAYQIAWFEGYAARGVGFELALGSELSFGRRRRSGISLALVLRQADLAVVSTPASPPPETTPIRGLDFSSVMFRVGFQLGV